MQIFILVLCFVTALAFILGPVFYLIDKDKPNWTVGAWFAVSFLCVGAVAGFVHDHLPPERNFTLTAAQWECTLTYQQRRFTGKYWTSDTLCSQYSRIGATQ